MPLMILAPPAKLNAVTKAPVIAIQGAPLPRVMAAAPTPEVRLGSFLAPSKGPEAPTTSAPLHAIHRAIENVQTTVRLPDRGAAVVHAGIVMTMPDGTKGGTAMGPIPLLSNLADKFLSIIPKGSNPQIRATQIKVLTQESYTMRMQDRIIAATKSSGGFGAVDYAMAKRNKPGTPTGIQGDRALENAQKNRAVVYATIKSPSQIYNMTMIKRTSGPAAAKAPTPVPISYAPTPTMATDDAVNKSFSFAPKAIEAGDKPNAMAEGVERFGLLIAVGVLGFFLIKGRV
jgi:hypothetical protein